MTYKDSGVDINKGNSFVKRIAPIVKNTFSEKVITDIGGFGALFSGSFPNLKDPVLVSGTDGAGTKTRIAQMMNKHDTIGIDAVAMCVNDILVSGASPLFFLDYISCGKLDEDVLVDIVKGIAEGCKQAGCSLIGGETAEHPNIMDEKDYDIAGFSVGVVDRGKIINGSSIRPNDVIIGLPSSGIHSNGYSMVRKLFFDLKKYTIETRLNDLNDFLGSELLKPTKIYCSSILTIIEMGLSIKGMVHITGGGFYENIPRILPEDTSVTIRKNSYNIPPIFKVIQKEGDVSEHEMFTTFNMGIGLMLFIDQKEYSSVMNAFKDMGEQSFHIGEVTTVRDTRVKLI